MKFNWKALALAALFDRAIATTAPGFPIAGGSPDLNVTFGSNNVSPPGELIPRGDTANPPTISTPVWTSSNKAIIMMVDTEVPRNNTRVLLLHWLVSNVTLSRTDNKTLSIPSTAEAAYRQPSPPVGDIPHAYTILLFAQPADWVTPSAFADVLQTRVPFDAAGYVRASGLGSVLAANYILVQNTSGTATTSFPPPASTSGAKPGNSSAPQPFPGSAATVGERVWLVVVGPVVLAGLMGLVL